MRREPAPDVATMLRRNGISGDERALAGGGYTNASITRIDSPNGSFVLKRLDPDDWVARFSGDASFREVQFALSPLAAQLPDGIAIATIDAAMDGAGRALLMLDVSEDLLPHEGLLDRARMDTVLRAAARLHASFHERPLDAIEVDWCAPRGRLLLTSPPVAQALVDEGRDFGIARGWMVFDAVAPPAAAGLARRLLDDPAPLLARLGTLPPTLIHGDFKLGNMALGRDGVLTLLDWSMVGWTPLALELMWLLAVNSSRLPWTLDETIERYAAHLERESGRPLSDVRWHEQLQVVALSGLMVYGWGKALDAEAGHPDELRWWCERALAAAAALDLR